MVNCSTCGKPTSHPLFDPYVMQVCTLNPEAQVPIFCSDECLICYVSIKTDKPIEEVRKDYFSYLEHR